MIVICGLRRVRDKILEREGLSEKVKVLDGGRIADRFVVLTVVKGALVARLREVYYKNVWAFGDSPLDLDMLCKADRAIVVVGEEYIRSKTMDAALIKVIDHDGLRASQVMLPSNVLSRLDTIRLFVIKFTDLNFVKTSLRGRYIRGGLQIHCATEKNGAKLLATPMRDAAVGGPGLREAHRRVG